MHTSCSISSEIKSKFVTDLRYEFEDRMTFLFNIHVSLTLCGHTSIIALFRFEVLNYFSIPVELHITYLLPRG